MHSIFRYEISWLDKQIESSPPIILLRQFNSDLKERLDTS